MATLKQIDANRRNALRSTGPRTEAGKQASSRNALKSGIFAGAETIPGESDADLATLRDEHHARFNPQTPEARDLVDSLIRHAWLLRRLARAEAAMFHCDCQQCEERYTGESENALISRRYANEYKKFEVLQRRINSTERNYHRTLKALQNLPAETVELICENEPNSPEFQIESIPYQPANSPAPCDPTDPPCPSGPPPGPLAA